jgi:hypothetical protein
VSDRKERGLHDSRLVVAQITQSRVSSRGAPSSDSDFRQSKDPGDKGFDQIDRLGARKRNLQRLTLDQSALDAKSVSVDPPASGGPGDHAAEGDHEDDHEIGGGKSATPRQRGRGSDDEKNAEQRRSDPNQR